MKEYIVDLGRVASVADLVDAFNSGLIRLVDGDWNGNLDALGRYLRWPNGPRYRLVLRGSAHARRVLGHDALTRWLKDRAAVNSPDLAVGKEALAAKLTFFDLVLGIVERCELVVLILE